MNFVNQRHPLLLHPGVSQRRRGLAELGVSYAKIDDRQLADLLNYFYEYSKQVNFHEYIKVSETEDYIALSDWSGFFEKSIPFLLARISKMNVGELDESLSGLMEEARAVPSAENLQPLFDFVYYELFLPFHKWVAALDGWQESVIQTDGSAPADEAQDFTFRQKLNSVIKGNLRHLLVNFMALGNGANKWHGTGAFPFSPFVDQENWGLSLPDTFAKNEAFLDAPGGEQGQFLQILDELLSITQPFMAALRDVVAAAPSHIKDSIVPLHTYWQERHEPHLGLVFAFLELFSRIQGDLNTLSQKHLDFFFKNVLRIKPRPAQPDSAHLVLEISKHLDRYLVNDGTLFRDGKDANNLDLLYRLNEEILIDKAQVAALKTLFLNKEMARLGPTEEPKAVIEGVYMAPVANSVDGQGEKFPDPATATWATLGAKESKFIPPGETVAQAHPAARIGFVLASPVLWLQEGKRRIKVRLSCDASGNADIGSEYFVPFLQSLEQSGIITVLNYFLKESHVREVADFLCPDTKSYLYGLLTKQNPYPIGSDIDEWIKNAKDPISCQQIFRQSEAEKIKELIIESKKIPTGLKRIHLQCAASDILPHNSDEMSYLEEIVEKNNGVYLLFQTIEEGLENLVIPERAILDEETINALSDYLEMDRPDDWPTDRKYNYYFKKSHLDDPNLPLPPDSKIRDYFIGLLKDRFTYPIGNDIVVWLQNIKYPTGETKKLSDDQITILAKCVNEDIVPLFNIALSGEKEWIVPKPENIKTSIKYVEASNILSINIQIDLSPDEPEVVFFNPEVLKEKFQLNKNLPVLKIELNDDNKFIVPVEEEEDGGVKKSCCLLSPIALAKKVSLYNFFRSLKITGANIVVEVCGLKKLVLQNDESLQDIKSVIYPFGLRPSVPDFNVKNLALVDEIEELEATGANLNGPSFYIGSKEVFFKKWNYVWVNIDWKGKPSDFEDHYKAYVKRGTSPDYIFGLREEDFKVKIALLEDSDWKKWSDPPGADPCFPAPSAPNRESRELFCHNVPAPFFPLTALCPNKRPETQIIEVRNFDNYNFIDYDKPLEVFQTASDGFLRLTLYGQDFLHKDYAYVLARQMMATGLLALKVDLNDAFYILGDGSIINTNIPEHELEEFQIAAENSIDAANGQINGLEGIITTSFTNIDTAANNINSSVGGIVSLLTTLKGLVFTDATNLQSLINAISQNVVSAVSATNNLQCTDSGTISIAQNEFGDVVAAVNVLVDFVTDIIVPAATSSPVLQTLIDHILNNSENLVDDVSDLNNTISPASTAIDNLDCTDNGTINTAQTAMSLVQTSMVTLVSFFNTVFVPALNAACDQADAAQLLIDTFVSTELPAEETAIEEAVDEASTSLGVALGQTNAFLNFILDNLPVVGKAALIPNEPWTPAIKEFSLDYTATAELEDIDLIHLYPFEGTSKPEVIEEQPTLLPTYTDEGTLFIGLKDLQPGSNLNLLLQLAEATADSELDRVALNWSYLAGNNTWRTLRPGFELLDDGTKGLTVSGIVKIAVPGDIDGTGYSIMPTGFHWIKVALPEGDPSTETCVPPIASRVKAVAEAVNVHAQAAEVTFQADPLNDLQRLQNELPAGSIAKLAEADFSIKKVQQPYPTFGGKVPEAEGNLYTRVSEHLRHKGRAIAPFDLERLVLDAFPQVYKVKTINHTFGLTARGYVRDLEVAPGFITLAVIPDLTKLRASDRSEPRCPVSLLEEIRDYLKKRMSPFMRLKVMNPRFEKIDVCVTVRLVKGKARDYYANKLKEDIRLFLAPWYLGDLDKMTFGQAVTWSDMVKYVESLDYVNFIDELKLVQVDKVVCEEEAGNVQTLPYKGPCDVNSADAKIIYPLTARSILTGGEICVKISQEVCDEYTKEDACLNKARAFGKKKIGTKEIGEVKGLGN